MDVQILDLEDRAVLAPGPAQSLGLRKRDNARR